MRVLYRSRVLKAIASLLLLEVGTQVLAPAVSYALTSGPTAPEATSFEPVDTTDMVDLASGDLTYSIPLLEVPGPEGGYPLALAYHAGIQPNEEASWVGLGWSLNPGAINRNVNGFADDFENVNQRRRDYWVGGTINTTSVGVTIGIPGSPASVSFGLSFSQDTYRGFGVGTNAGVGSSFDLGPASLGVSASVYTDGYGNSGAGIGVGLTVQSASGFSGTVGVSASTSGGFGAGASVGYSQGPKDKKIGTTLLGASLSSQSSSPSLTVGGVSATVENGNAGKIQTEVSSFGVSIPFPGGSVNLRQSDVRYWSDETVDVATNGSLYFPTYYVHNTGAWERTSGAPWRWRINSTNFDTKAFDIYRLPDPENENVFDNPDPNWVQGGSYPDYDNYVVSGQGIGGSMRPYNYQTALYGQNSFEQISSGKSYKIITSSLPWDNKAAFFRFDNDFSNQYRQNKTGGLTVSGSYSSHGYVFDGIRYNFDTQPQHGGSNSLGYDSDNERIAGSKAIEYYTNHQIVTGQARVNGFVDQAAKGFTRHDNSQIGGFSITNASGVTYHYALPVYALGEQIYTQKVGSDGGTYSRITKPGEYAYTWYLTAVTGPDYVDKNEDGLAGKSDWGYYVTFNYGKWTDSYYWRNPSEGYHRDADATFENYSSGTKELFYLNSVTTRTHTALFIKSYRADGKGRGFSNTNPYGFYSSFDCGPPVPGIPGGCAGLVIFPAVQLKLDKIVTLKNEDIPSNLEDKSTLYNTKDYYDVDGTISGRSFGGENIIDAADCAATPSLISNSINSVVFKYNYSLCSQTTNSWDETGASYTSFFNFLDGFQNPAVDLSLRGKLTLSQTQNFGPSGNGSMPPTKFGYELGSDERVSGLITPGPVSNSQGDIALPPSSPFRIGDILAFAINGKKVTCALTANTSTANTLKANYFGYSPPRGTYGSYVANTTKNPSYSRDSYDVWGMFKSDFNIDLSSLAGYDESLARATSEISSRQTDVWSLRTIQTPLGGQIKLQYGSDTYRTRVLIRPNMVVGFGGSECRGTAAGIGVLQLGNRLVIPATAVFYRGQSILISGVVETYHDDGLDDSWASYEAVKDIPVIVDNVQDRVGSGTNYLYLRENGRTIWQPEDGNTFTTLRIGHIKIPENPAIRYGGGIRVEAISVKTPDMTKTTQYAYGNNQLPSGVTSYEPGSYMPIKNEDYTFCSNLYGQESANATKTYARQYLGSLPKLLELARILPAPGVMYEYITVSDRIKRRGVNELETPQKTVYQLEVLKPNMVDLVGEKNTSITGYDNYPSSHEVRTREVAIQDFTTRVGRLKRRTTYDASGAKLNETVNHYLHDDLNDASLTTNAALDASGYAAKLAQFGYIGMIQEVFGDSRLTRRNDMNYDRKVTMSRRNAYPVVLIGTTTTDFKTNKSVTTDNKAFDLLSGEVTKMLTTDGYGNRVSSESTPAYRVYPDLGPKMGDNGGRNMLTQSAGSAQYKVDAQGNKLGLISASAQTWSSGVPVIGTILASPAQLGAQYSIWRPRATYSWLPLNATADGLTPLTGPGAFTDFFTGGGSTSWQRTAEVTLYDVYSSALEAMDVNNQYVATKKGYDNSRVIMSGGPAAYNEIAYSGLEDAPRADGSLSGGISLAWPTWATSDATIFTDAAQTSGNTHTGTKSLQLKPYKYGLSYELPVSWIQPNKAYRVSVWANRPEAQAYYQLDADGVDRGMVGGNAQKQANGWYLIELTIPPIGNGHNSFRVGCYNSGTTDAYLDDFRFQPIDAQCTAYVYNDRTGQLTDLLDNSNLATHYQYDATGRLIKVSRETFKYNTQLLKEFAYQYGPAAPALDGVTLTVTPAGRTVQAAIGLPSTLTTANCTIQYSPGGGASYSPTTQLNLAYTYPNAGTYWFRVKVQDKDGKQRELVSKVLVP